MTNKEKEKEAIKALKWLVEHSKEVGLSYVDCVSVEALDVAIKVLEERPQGEWINEYWEDAYQEYYHTCDVCKKEIVKTEYDNYCSCCGAKMRKGEAEND